MKTYFDHEKLNVYQTAVRFASWTEIVLQEIPRSFSVHDQLDRASTSIPLNIAEGNGKFTSPDRCRFFDVARGSAFECAACLDVLMAKGKLSAGKNEEGKQMFQSIVSMLVGLIKSNSSERLHEDPIAYGERAGE